MTDRRSEPRMPSSSVVARSACEFAASLFFHEIFEDGLQVVVGRGDLVDRAERSRSGQIREARVERVWARRLHYYAVLLEPQAQHVVVCEKLAGEGAGLIGFDV